MKPQMSCITWKIARYGSRVPYSNSWPKLKPLPQDWRWTCVDLSVLLSLPVSKLSWFLKVYGLLTWPKVSILGFPGGTRFWSWGVLGPEEWGDEPRREDTLGLVNDG